MSEGANGSPTADLLRTIVTQELHAHKNEMTDFLANIVASAVQKEITQAVSKIDKLEQQHHESREVTAAQVDGLVAALDKQHDQLGQFFSSFKRDQEEQQAREKREHESKQTKQMEELVAIRQMLKHQQAWQHDFDQQQRKITLADGEGFGQTSGGSRIRSRLQQQKGHSPINKAHPKIDTHRLTDQMHQIQQDVRSIQRQIEMANTRTAEYQEQQRQQQDRVFAIQDILSSNQRQVGEASDRSRELQKKVDALTAATRQQLSRLEETKQLRETAEKRMMDQQVTRCY
jgi:hypothetical protein